MKAGDKDFVGSIPDIYDTLLVPLIFESYADDLADRVVRAEPSRILETAAGSGVVTRSLAANMAQDARYQVTDLNQPMLDRARAVQADDTRISWLAADAMDLPFDDNSFDAVVCQFGVMFFPDKVSAFREVHRVLADDGVFVFNTWDSIIQNEFADAVTQAAGRFFPDDPPRFLARIPHGYFDIEEITAQLRGAGFSNVQVSTITDECTAASPRIPAVAYCQGTPLRNEIEARDPHVLEQVTELAARDIQNRWGSGAVSAKMQGHVFEARP